MLSTYQVTYVLSYLPPNMPSSGWYIAGGAATSFTYSDVDIFFHTEADYQAVRSLFASYYLENETDQAVTFRQFSDPFYPGGTRGTKGPAIQLVHRHFGPPEQILSGFDLNVCRCAILPDKSFFQLPEAADFLWVDVDQLRENTISRFFKYVHRGFFPDPSQFEILIRTLVENPTAVALSYYSKHDRTYLDLLKDLFSSPATASLVARIIDSYPAKVRHDMYLYLVKPDSEYMPTTYQSPELQLALAKADINFATPYVCENYPEIFI